MGMGIWDPCDRSLSCLHLSSIINPMQFHRIIYIYIPFYGWNLEIREIQYWNEINLLVN
jgi:hypothetical protein